MFRLTIHERATYLRDAVFAASDGLVTTFAVVAGSTGAGFTRIVVLILGFANLFADGFSMAAGSYLGTKSETDYEEAKGHDHEKDGTPVKHASVTFTSFVFFGFLPLLPYAANYIHKFILSVILIGLSLFMVGGVRSRFSKKGFARGAFEMLFVGGFAAFVAYTVGLLLKQIIG